MLFRKMFAFSSVADLKNSFAVSFISIAVTSPLLDATLIIFWYFGGNFVKDFDDFSFDCDCNCDNWLNAS